MDTSSLPTPLAQVVGRLAATGTSESADSFRLASHAFEGHLKLITMLGVAGFAPSSPDTHYRFCYRLARADGIGEWGEVLGRLLSHDLATLLPAQLRPLLDWIGRRRSEKSDPNLLEALQNLHYLLGEIGFDAGRVPERFMARHLLQRMVEIRNKDAHVALGPEFYSMAAPLYWKAVEAVIESFPFGEWDWVYLWRRGEDETRGIGLTGSAAKRRPDESVARLCPQRASIYANPVGDSLLLDLAPLLQTTRECQVFWFANGHYSSGQATVEFVDMARGRCERRQVQELSAPPAPKPKSETEGSEVLDVHSNLWGNLPPVPDGYVSRESLEADLLQRIQDRNHAIITLHGYGGVGKTTLALEIAHLLARQGAPRFDSILWLSARDIDLTIHGPRAVRRHVTDLDAIARAVGRLLDGRDESCEQLATRLQIAQEPFERGTLFVLDNFETLDDIRGIHEFLDSNAHPPNKVLLTSRERAFKADYPIEVRGMEHPEAMRLLQQLAEELGIEGVLTHAVREQIFRDTQGHPYLMKVLAGETAKSQRYVPFHFVFAQQDRIRDALFERTFSGLSEDGRRVFLCVATWRSPTLEVALEAVLLPRGVNVEAGIEECRRLSLIQQEVLGDESLAFHSPPVARAFAEKKLKGDPDRLVIEEDIDLLRRFAPFDAVQASHASEDSVVRRFLKWCREEASTGSVERLELLVRTLESLAELRPRVWLEVAEFRKQALFDEGEINQAYRRASEELSHDPTVWEERALFARSMGDETLWIQCLVSSAEADPSNLPRLREVAFQLCGYIDAHREIPPTRRGVYLASVRNLLRDRADELDATGLSRLAWLFLLEGKEKEAEQFAKMGLAKERTNNHCLRILKKLTSSTG